MARISSFDIFAVDLPFRRAFEHAAARRTTSESIFLKCTTDTGAVGFGESLPRPYVTGESRDSAYALLCGRILPRLVGAGAPAFESYDEVRAFLRDCDGKPPVGWVDPDNRQTAAWCAVDLALLDAFGRAFGRSAIGPEEPARVGPSRARYSGVLSAPAKNGPTKQCLLFRAYGLRQVKMKVGQDGDVASVRTARKWLGRKTELRVDANMAWSLERAVEAMQKMARLGVDCFEQPLAADALDETAALVRRTGLTIMADESFNDRDSLTRLIEKRACTAVNVRISKCGGLTASLRRCQEALEAGLTIQVGCQVGESSLLSAAQLALLAQVPAVTYAEGCFGRFLLRDDVATPILQFGRGGRPPRMPAGTGLGVRVDEQKLRRWTVRSDRIVAE
jgi:muconate cycloisomerase